MSHCHLGAELGNVGLHLTKHCVRPDRIEVGGVGGGCAPHGAYAEPVLEARNHHGEERYGRAGQRQDERDEVEDGQDRGATAIGGATGQSKM